MTRANALVVGVAALFSLALAAAPAGRASAQSLDQPVATVVPDDAYGEGGTKVTLSNDRRQLIAEVWRDKDGVIREQFEPGEDGAEYWGFFVGENMGGGYEFGGLIEIRPIGGPAGRWLMVVYGPGRVLLKEYGFLSKGELDVEFANWRTQMRGWVNGFLHPAEGG